MSKSDEWSSRLARFESSNESVTEFCRAEGVSTASFYAWRRRLRPRFVELVAGAGAADRLVVHVGEVRVEVPADFDPAHLRALVAALQ